MNCFAFSWQNFWFSFLALVFEGVPFIVLGSLISGLIGSFIPVRPAVARMAFMIFGLMFDLKLIFLYSALFKKRFVVALGAGLFVFVGLVCGIILSDVYASQGF